MSADLLNSILDALGSQGSRPKRCGEGKWSAKCPAHDGTDYVSLTVTDASDKVLMICHSKGCTYQDILAALDIDPKRETREEGRRYVYRDEKGTPIHGKVRRPGKKFSQVRYENDVWVPGTVSSDKRVPFNLSGVIKATERSDAIYVVEGEKDCENLVREGLVATTFVGGSNGWQDSYAKWFKGAEVVIIPDRDIPGQKLRNAVVIGLKGIAKSIKVIDLPYEIVKDHGKDVSDYLSENGTLTELLKLVKDPDPPPWPEGTRPMAQVLEELKDYMPPPREHYDMFGLGPRYQIPGIGARDILVFAARLGVGKTMWAVNLTANLIEHKTKALVCTFEVSTEEYLQSIAAALTYDGGFTHPDYSRRRWAKEVSEELRSQLLFCDWSCPVEHIQELVARHESKVVVIDHLGLIKASGGKTKRNDQLEHIMNGLRDMVKRQKCAVVLLAQLNRASTERFGRAITTDLYGSDVIGHAADFILALEKPMKEPKASAEMKIETVQAIADIDTNNGEAYRILHTIKSRWSADHGLYYARMCAKERVFFRLHKTTCRCDEACKKYRDLIEKRLNSPTFDMGGTGDDWGVGF